MKRENNQGGTWSTSIRAVALRKKRQQECIVTTPTTGEPKQHTIEETIQKQSLIKVNKQQIVVTAPKEKEKEKGPVSKVRRVDSFSVDRVNETQVVRPPQTQTTVIDVSHSKRNKTLETKSADSIAIELAREKWPLVSPSASPMGHPEGALERALSAVSRKSFVLHSNMDLDFQIISEDYVTMPTPPPSEKHLRPSWVDELEAERNASHPQQQQNSNNNASWINKPWVRPQQQQRDARKGGNTIRVPVVRLTGVMLDGTTIHVRVHCFEPYAYALLPPGSPFDAMSEGTLLHDVRKRLDTKIGAVRSRSGRMKKGMNAESDAGIRVVRVMLVRKTPIRGYHNSLFPFLRIWTSIPEYVTHLRQVLEEPNSAWEGAPALKTYESDILFPLRFVVDHGIAGGSWVRILASHPGTVVKEVPIGYGPLDTEFEGGGECAKGNRRCVFSDLIGEEEGDASTDGGADNGKWTSPNDSPFEASRCNINVFAHTDAIVSLGSEGKWAINAPMVIASHDSEWLGNNGAFPRKGRDPIISAVVSVAVVGSDVPKISVALQLGECLPCGISGVHTVWFDDEASLLLALRDVFVAADADIITGYNINNFDEPFLDERAKSAKIYDKFSDRGRYPTIDGRERINRGTGGFSSKAKGAMKIEDVVIPGRLMHDMCIVFKREQDNLSRYTLNSVSQHYLGRLKIDVSPNEIPSLFAVSPETRKKLLIYCHGDTCLPIALASNRKIIEGHVEMARCTGVPLSFLLMKGQQVKVHAKFLAACKNTTILVETAARKIGSKAGSKYAGATVLTPDVGFHDIPVPTLDFYSMYPTIMLGHNLCYTTFLTEEQALAMHPNNIFTLPSGDKFVAAPKLFDTKDLNKLGLQLNKQYELFPDGKGYLSAGVTVPRSVAETLKLNPVSDYTDLDSETVTIDTEKRHGILPRIVRELLSARGLAKARMSDAYKAGDKTLGEVYNQRQLALKSTANSVYGFTGAQNGKMPATVIAGGVTAVGRGMIEYTKYIVESEFPGAKVLYGDTDSVMVDFGISRPSDEAIANACLVGVLPLLIGEFATLGGKEESKTASQATIEAAKATSAIALSRLPYVSPTEKGVFLSRIRTVCKIVEDELLVAFELVNEKLHQQQQQQSALAITATETKTMKCLLKCGQKKLSSVILNAGKLPATRIAAELAKKASAMVTDGMCYPKKLEFEKVLFPWLSISRKRYVGCKIMNDKEDEIPLAMGIETRRRDNCELVRNTMEKIIDMVLKRGDLRGAVLFVRHVVECVYARDVPLNMLIITSGYSKKETFYATKQKHIEVIKKMRERDPASAPVLGDRVAFVIVEGMKNAKNYEKAEEAMYALDHDLPIDTTYYVTHQLKKPVGRLMKGVLKDPKRLFNLNIPISSILSSVSDSGSAAAAITKEEEKKSFKSQSTSGRGTSEGRTIRTSRAPTNVTGTIETHAKPISEPCLSCGCSIPMHQVTRRANPVCGMCHGTVVTACLSANLRRNTIERQLTALMSHCYRCSESISVMSSEKGACRNDLCPFTYIKVKLLRDIEDSIHVLERFSQ